MEITKSVNKLKENQSRNAIKCALEVVKVVFQVAECMYAELSLYALG